LKDKSIDAYDNYGKIVEKVPAVFNEIKKRR
jgi:hypothetical protein